MGGKVAEAEGLDAGGGNLDGERVAVEAAADFGDQRHVGVGELKDFRARRGAFDEQFDGRNAQGLDGEQILGLRWDFQRQQPEDPFAFRPHRLGAGGEDVEARRVTQHLFGDLGHRVDNVLAIVEQQQQMPLLEMRNEAQQRIAGRHRDLERHGDSLRQAFGIGRGGAEIDDDDAVVERLLQLLRHGERHRGLADATGAGNGDEPAPGDPLDQGRNLFSAADNASQRGGTVVAARRCRAGRRPVADRGDEAIAAAADIGDVLRRIVGIAEHLAQRCDVDAEVGFLDKGIRPHPAIRSCRLTSSPFFSTRAISSDRARLPRRTAAPFRSRTCLSKSSTKGPNSATSAAISEGLVCSEMSGGVVRLRLRRYADADRPSSRSRARSGSAVPNPSTRRS